MRTPTTNSAKWHFHNDNNKVLEFWLADMDYKIMPILQKKLIEYINEGDLGYAFVPDSYFKYVKKWSRRYCTYEINREWIIPVTNSIMALCAAIQALTTQEDNIALFTPSYHAFSESIVRNKRNVIGIKLYEQDGKYQIDFHEMSNIIKETRPKMLILCNPHNPTGKMFEKEEILKIIKICMEEDIFIISDEIHQDITFTKNHKSLLNYLKLYKNIVIIQSPTKSFNIAGIKLANMMIPKKEIREKVERCIKKNGAITPNAVAIKSCEICYKYGDEWLERLNGYLYENQQIALQFFEKVKDKIEVYCPEGTYFLWIKAKFQTDSNFQAWLLEKANIRLECGSLFGIGYEKYARMTLACSRKNLETALERMKKIL